MFADPAEHSSLLVEYWVLFGKYLITWRNPERKLKNVALYTIMRLQTSNQRKLEQKAGIVHTTIHPYRKIELDMVANKFHQIIFHFLAETIGASCMDYVTTR